MLLLCASFSNVAATRAGAVPNIPVARGAGQLVFGDLPIVPGSYPDYGAHRFSLSGNPKIKPQAFNYGTTASPWNVLTWYRARLPRLGWHIDSVRTNYPAPNDAAIVASRRGEGVTVIVEYGGNGGSRVSLVKLNASR